MSKDSESNSKNIYLFFGEDDFSLRRKIDIWKAEFAKKYTSQAISFFDAENIGEIELIKSLENLLAPSLFTTKKLIILRNALPKKADQETLTEFLLNLPPRVSKDYFMIFWQTAKLDGRLKFTKQFKNLVTVTEFELPHGLVLNQWIKAMAKTLKAEISDSAADRLAQFLGRDLFEEKKFGGKVVERKEAFDLWQVYSELLKLSSNTSQIEPANVSALVKPKIPDSVFALTDEVIAKNQKGAFVALENFLSTQTTEEKTTFIKIIGLLSEQLRSLLIVALLQKKGEDNEQIAEKLGYSPGRVFITARNSKNVSIEKLKILLKQLLTIDYRIKSSDTNTKLEIDLFLARATD
jgi:DNA polymerase III delta subunit